MSDHPAPPPDAPHPDSGGSGHQTPTLLPPLILLRDLGGQLIWPRLLRVPAAALWPSRLVLGVIVALTLGLVGSLSRLWSSKPAFLGAALESQLASWNAVLVAALGADVPGTLGALRRAMIDAPTALLTDYPASTPILTPVLLGLLVAFGGAIARSVAAESATERRPPAARMLGWSLARWPSAFAAIAVPLAAVWLLIVLMRSLGWLTLAFPVLDTVGALLFPIQFLLALATLAIILGLGTTGPLIVPARMVEDSDAIDAVQRCLAYAIARPLRLLLYLAITLGVCTLALALARALLGGAWALSLEHAGAWLSPEREAALTGVIPAAADGSARSLPASTRAAHWLIGLWSQIPAVLIGGYAISLFFTAGTSIYLAIREVCDGQDPAEIQGEPSPGSGPDGNT